MRINLTLLVHINPPMRKSKKVEKSRIFGTFDLCSRTYRHTPAVISLDVKRLYKSSSRFVEFIGVVFQKLEKCRKQCIFPYFGNNFCYVSGLAANRKYNCSALFGCIRAVQIFIEMY